MSLYRIQQLESCDTQMFGDLVLTCRTPVIRKTSTTRMLHPVPYKRSFSSDIILQRSPDVEKRRASALVDQLLMDIYSSSHFTTDYNSGTSGKSNKSVWVDITDFTNKDLSELSGILEWLREHVERMGSVLVRQLKRRDALRRQQDLHCDVITAALNKHVTQGNEEMRFTIEPKPGESGFSQWAAAMKMVAQLPGGIPPEFRRRLWLTLAERHLVSQNVDWAKVERNCFSEWSHPADSELGVQIVKDLHRTGCSLFCGEDGQENQALLKRVLLAYARWNKSVGYCQGFNMLAALILQVTDKCESEALKLMIYLIEGVLPESYFADSLRGLSVDMAVFRELLRSRLPRLSKHLDTLQNAAKDGNTSYEPPLTNVFTMQWFLTLFCNCLPQPTVLRVWDLILLEGNEILLRTALAIWQTLAERIMGVRSADEFYCIMGVLTRELLEFSLIDANSLIKAVVSIGPLTELKTLRDHYMYNINPWGGLQQAVVDKQLKLYPREKLVLDISALKKQYDKLKQRQRQAHIIFSAAISRQPATSTPVAMNHLLLGKSALVPAKRLGPPKGTIPPARQVPPTTLHWKDTKKNNDSSSDSSDTELCDDGDDDDDDDDVSSKHSDIEELGILDKEDNLLETNITIDEASTDNFDNLEKEASTSATVGQDDQDDNLEFEKFLKDRMRCLNKQESIPEEDKMLSRRNSTRALQIIQENSLILHRILQCQTRLTPSPPLLLDSDEDTPLKTLEMPENDIKASISEPEMKTVTPTSPEYGNKYTSILEKSKSLDERYNSLILNQPPKKSEQSNVIIEEKLINLGDNLPDTKDEDPIEEETQLKESIEEETQSIIAKDTVDSGFLSSGSMDTRDNELTIEEIKRKYSKPRSDHVSSFYEKSFSDDQKETFSRFSSFNYRKFLLPTNEDAEIINLEPQEAKTFDISKYMLEQIDDKSPLNKKSILEELNDSKTGQLDLDISTDEETKTCYSYLKSPVSEFYPQIDEENKSPTHEYLKPAKMSPKSEQPMEDKSPSKIFNPFPVPLSSRQNKEVPLKLGLYRK